jgi:hypothetical protein
MFQEKTLERIPQKPVGCARQETAGFDFVETVGALERAY